ncbi:MAG: hypothetical protein A2070_12380 [Bdellovibrionales bacterium GWC1_52_8]|nr:MAG: hypothetical protein A2070_12380 [Bdellovibrionales bacterium GWC1_52_8]
MVRTKSALFYAVASCLLVTSISGCSLKRFWGEPAANGGVIEMPASTGECRPLSRILEAEDEESQATLNCWAGTLEQIWTRIAGRERDVLSNDEINVLVKKGILTFGGGIESDQAKLVGIRRLLGLGNSLHRSELKSWIDLFKSKRVDLRLLYSNYQLRSQKLLKLQYSDIALAASALGPVLQKMNWSMSSAELSATLLGVLDVKDPEVRKMFEPASALAINFLNSICPSFTAKDMWSTSELGTCLVKGTQHFAVGAAWFEFVFDPVDVDYLLIAKARDGLEAVYPRVESWFKDPSLTKFAVQRVLDFSLAMGVTPPESLTRSLDILSRFNDKSSGDFFDPTLYSRLFGIFAKFQDELLVSMEPFIRAQLRGACANAQAENWHTCILDVPSRFARAEFPLRRALQIKNVRYGMKVDPFNGNRFSWILFYDRIAAEMITAFAGFSKDGKKETVIRSQLGDDSDPVVQLISGGLESYETVRGFIVNIQRKIQGLPFVDSNTFQKLRFLNPKGLARLVTMTNQLLVQRSFEDRNSFEKAAAMLTNLSPESPVYLDRLALAAVLNLVDSLGAYKQVYLHHLQAIDSRDMRVWAKQEELDSGVDYLISREDFRQSLSELLRDNFPRTFESCMEFHFETSCAIAFDQILPDVDGKPGFIHLGDLDAVTIMASAMEGLFDTCDQSGDGKLSWSLFDGNDELDCAYVKIKDTIKRLIQARIISSSKTERAGINFLLDFMNANVLTRAMGKASLMRGTKSNMIVNWPLFWMNRDASIGSVYGLLADVIDHDEVNRLRKQQKPNLSFY